MRSLGRVLTPYVKRGHRDRHYRGRWYENIGVRWAYAQAEAATAQEPPGWGPTPSRQEARHVLSWPVRGRSSASTLMSHFEPPEL